MNKRVNKKIVSGYIMAIIGFGFILISALNYLFGWKLSTVSGPMGILFVAMGMAIVRKASK